MDADYGSDTRRDSPYELDEEDTQDSFSKKMIREMHEQAAKWRAEHGRPQAFRKARPQQRAHLTIENLERVTVTVKEQEPVGPAYGRQRAGSSYSGSSNSDPPLNVPRHWGRKARRNADWLKRITMPPEAVEETPKVASSGDPDWSAAAEDVPFPSVEDSPSSRRGSRRGTPHVVRENASIEEIQETERELSDEPFGGSFITSTPAVMTRNTRLDEIRQQELEDQIKEAEDTRLYPTPPPDRRQSKLRARATKSRRQEEDPFEGSFQHPAEQVIDIPKRTASTRSTTTAVSQPTLEPPKSPIAVTKSAHTVGNVDRQVLPDIQKSPERPLQKREDSRDLLRRLSRATSQTPSPQTRNPISKLSPKKLKTTRVQSELKSHEAEKSSNLAGPSTAVISQKENLPPGKQNTSRSNASLFIERPGPQLPELVRAEKASGSGEREDVVETQPEPKTPLVTGAYINTPGQSSKAPSQASDDTAKAKDPVVEHPKQPSTALTSTKPSNILPDPRNLLLPQSALSAVLDSAHARGLKSQPAGPGDLGDSTIFSLEEIAHPDQTHSSYLDEDDDGELSNIPEDQLTTRQRRRLQEKRTLRAMNARLRAAKDSIRDTRHGLKRVEQQARDAAEHTMVAEQQIGDIREVVRPASRASQREKGKHDCPGEQIARRPDLVAWRLFKGMWFYRDQDERFHLTILSLALLTFLAWFILEFFSW
jgi:hypothetical protein